MTASLPSGHGIRVEAVSDSLVLTATGELDAYVAPALDESLAEAGIAECVRFVADLSRVSFMDSTALGLLVRTVRDVTARDGVARVVLPTTSARRIFEITTLDRTLPLATSRVEALRELEASSGITAGDDT